MGDLDTEILIAGGGPVGLILAHELAHRGVRVMLVERNPHSTRHPKMDVTNARSMEHLRRLGLADAVRQHATPAHNPATVVWTDRLGGRELARFEYPSYATALQQQARIHDGTGVAEPMMRVSQVVLEPVLCELLSQRHGARADVQFGWRLDGFQEDDASVLSTVTHAATGRQRTIRSLYLAGCDGAGSIVRRGLGIAWDVMNTRLGPLVAIWRRYGFWSLLSTAARALLLGRQMPDGRVYLIHFESQEREFLQRHGSFWHKQCAQTGDTLISQNDRDTWTLHVLMNRTMDPAKLDPARVLFERLGRSIECKILAANDWRPALTVAKRFGRGRVWLAGDACHQVIPTGGYGMNTGVSEAITLGWMLAAVVQGWGGPRLLPAYEAERLPVIRANRRASALHAGVRLMITTRGRAYAERIGEYIRRLGNLENEALGLELDYRYERSPVICQEAGEIPAWRIDAITPSTRPGCRLPHVWLAPGVSVFDKLGQGLTLIRTADVDVSSFVQAAAALRVPLSVVDIRDAKVAKLYERALILVRPDQHVAWRGEHAQVDVSRVLRTVTGRS
jgi:2-polyprenyl-6-methoxyphenol hydroxylase-like FAD-dependent oxidoreductase